MGQPVSIISLRSHARDLRLEGPALHANVQIPPEMPPGIPPPPPSMLTPGAAGVEPAQWRESSINLDSVLSNDQGSFRRGGAFSKSAREVQLAGTVLVAMLNSRSGWKLASIDLDNLLTVTPTGELAVKDESTPTEPSGAVPMTATLHMDITFSWA